MTDVRATRVAKLIEAHDRGDHDAIRFIRFGLTVHVLSPDGDVPQRYLDLFGNSEAEQRMRFALGECWAVCGTRFVRHRGGFEAHAQLISHFPDDQLCRRCWAAFGPEYGHLIFAANQDDGRDPTQLSHLIDDVVVKGKSALQ